MLPVLGSYPANGFRAWTEDLGAAVSEPGDELYFTADATPIITPRAPACLAPNR